MLIRDVFKLANKLFFFNPIMCDSSKTVLGYNLGASGSLLQENIKAEWIYSNVTNRDVNMFLNTWSCVKTKEDNIIQLYTNARDICNKQLPFGVAEIYNENNTKMQESLEKNCFLSHSNTVCSSTLFLPPTEGMQYFFHWQRQRKLWWKKISAFPGRFILGEISSLSKWTTVEIIAKFPWGNQVLETVSIASMDESYGTDLFAQHGQKNVIPTMLRSKLILECAVIALFCDALDEDSIHKTPALRLHRKLSPYKCIFAAPCSNASSAEELSQLSFYLTKQFRKVGIPTILLSDCINSPLVDQFQRNDEWGIPYTIVLNDDSLKSGIVNLRNRDTTLNETVYISELITYISQQLRNF